MKRLLMSIMAAMLTAGCATIPFDPMPATRPGPLSADAVRDAFAAAQPRRYEALQSVVFQMYGRKMGGIGSLAVDYTDNAFALAAMTHTGMKLFELQGDAHAIKSEFALATFGEQDQLAEAVGADVRRIYFNTIPPEDADVHRRRYKLVFVHRFDGGRTEYDFAGPQQRLAEKRIYDGRRLATRIRYGDYQDHDGGLHAHAVILHNRVRRYRLILRLKSVYSLDEP